MIIKCDCQIWSSGIWRTCSSLNHLWIALHYIFGSFKSHLTKTYYWRYRVNTDILCKYLLYCYKDLMTSFRNSSLFVHINISICTRFHIFVQFRHFELIFLLLLFNILTILYYISHKISNMMLHKKNYAIFLDFNCILSIKCPLKKTIRLLFLMSGFRRLINSNIDHFDYFGTLLHNCIILNVS